MHDSIIRAAEAADWQHWLDSPAGRYALAWEQRQLDAEVADLFGYYALQLGLPGMPALRMNRMPSRILARREPDGGAGPEGGAGLDSGAGSEGGSAGQGGGLDASPAGTDHGPHQAEQGPGGRLAPGADRSRPEVAAVPTEVDAQPGLRTGAAEAQALLAAMTAPALAAGEAPTGGPTPAWTHQLEVADFEDLPFADQSLDLIVLPHVLEFSPDPHRVLREVDRCLRPDGRVLITGFNPISLWGARQRLPRALARPFLPPSAHFIGAPRLRDWFKLLSFEPARAQFGCYRPALRSQIWLDRTRWFEGLGDRCWPICGGVYSLSAVKRVRAIRLVGPAWPARAAKRGRVAVAASSNRQHRDREL